jgi:hypothetical protein
LEGVRDLHRSILDVPTLWVEFLRGRLLFSLRKTDEGGFVSVFEAVRGYFWWRTRLNRRGAKEDQSRQCRCEREREVNTLTQMNTMLGLGVSVGFVLVC